MTAWERDPSTDGVSRQLAAILSTGDRTEEVRRIVAPALVIHGDKDRMVAPSGGRATHHAIAGSKLWVVPGMGHDYPRQVWPDLVRAIADHANAAGPANPPVEHDVDDAGLEATLASSKTNQRRRSAKTAAT